MGAGTPTPRPAWSPVGSKAPTPTGTPRVRRTGDHHQGRRRHQRRHRAFTYTPTQAARLAAGAATTATDPAKTDTFTVTVTDGIPGHGHQGGHGDRRPEQGTDPLSVTVNTPNPTTGVVTSSVKATDPDKDVLKFTTPASTARGALSINASTGEFTFTRPRRPGRPQRPRLRPRTRARRSPSPSPIPKGHPPHRR